MSLIKPLKYSYDSLLNFCSQNNITLCRDYSEGPVNRDTRIEGKCITIGCDNLFCKSFREILENNTHYCRSCLKTLSNIKRKQTCVNKYGVQTVMSLKETKEKIKETSLQKYGVEFPFQSELVKDKIKKTNIERYGCDNPNQNNTIREKGKKTCLEKYGVEHILQSDIFKEKYKSIILEKFGVENPSQNEEIKQKKISTSLKNYGVEHPMQNSEVLSNNIKNNYKTKPYIFPSGKVEQIQGDEKYALDELIYSEKIDENDIITGIKYVPIIWYLGKDYKKHRHYVDIFISSQNRCIEVKSTWTAKKNEHNIYLKQNAAKELGYKYELWIYNEKKQKVYCYY